MATQSEISKSNSVFNIQSLSRTSIFIITTVLLILIVISVSFFVLKPEEGTANLNNRALQAWAARYQGQADAFLGVSQPVSQRSLDAWAARYQGQADAFLADSESVSQRSLDAWAARYQGLAKAPR
jgi:hemoglobin-like flavoprotein